MEEKILISIELQKGDGEKQVDALTQKITQLQHATAELKKENNELIKAGKTNSDQYIENTRQIEINKQKINEATASRKGLVQTLLSEENSIKSLRVANAELIKQRDNITTSTAEGRAEIARLNTTIDENNELIEKNLDKAGKQKAAIGGYKDAIKDSIPFFRQGETAFHALAGSANVFGKALIATGIGVFIVLLGSLIAYFKGSEEGQNKLNKVLAIGSAILEQFMNVLEDVGGALVAAFENPEKAAKQFLEFLQSQFVNRITGILQLIPELGRAVEQLFKGNFAEAGEIALNAVGKVALGVENTTQLLKDFANETKALFEQGVAFGERVAKIQADINVAERELIVKRQKDALEVAKIRAQAAEVEGEQRKKLLLEAIALEEELSKKETALANLRLAEAEAILQKDGADIETKKAVAEAQAAVFAAEATAFQNTLRFRKEIAAIDEASAKEQAKLLEEADAMIQKAHEEEMARIEKEKEARIGLEELRLQNEVDRAASIEERVAKEIELETFKAFTLLENTALVEGERQLIIEKSQKAINDIIVKGTTERVKKEEAEEKRLADLKKRERDAEIAGKFAVAQASLGLLREVFGENKLFAIAQVGINTAQAIVNALAMSGPPWVGIAMAAIVGAIGAAQSIRIAGIEFAKGGLIKMARGGIAAHGGVLRGPLHRDGGIPFTVNGRHGFEAEGGEAIINRRSTRMFRSQLSAINQAGGGVAFGRGGVARFQTGSIVGSQTRAAASQADSRTIINDAIRTTMENMPPIVVSVIDINERAQEYSDSAIKSNVV